MMPKMIFGDEEKPGRNVSINTLEKWAKRLFPYNLALPVLYVGLPLYLLSSVENEATLNVLGTSLFLQADPTGTLFLGMFFGLRHGFRWVFVLCTALWSLLAVLLFFGGQQLFLVLLCAGAGAGGCYAGGLFKNYRDEMYL